jgi:hypothetical protein
MISETGTMVLIVEYYGQLPKYGEENLPHPEKEKNLLEIIYPIATEVQGNLGQIRLTHIAPSQMSEVVKYSSYPSSHSDTLHYNTKLVQGIKPGYIKLFVAETNPQALQRESSNLLYAVAKKLREKGFIVFLPVCQ